MTRLTKADIPESHWIHGKYKIVQKCTKRWVLSIAEKCRKNTQNDTLGRRLCNRDGPREAKSTETYFKYTKTITKTSPVFNKYTNMELREHCRCAAIFKNARFVYFLKAGVKTLPAATAGGSSWSRQSADLGGRQMADRIIAFSIWVDRRVDRFLPRI